MMLRQAKPEPEEEPSEASGSDGDSSWVQWFCSLKGNEFFAEVDAEFMQDDFNLTGLSAQVPYYEYALDTVMDAESLATANFSKEQQESIESAAELLYGLIHARYIITPLGMAAMLEKFKHCHFGRCPRVHCQGQPALPVGQSDLPRMHTTKIFCPRCQDIFYPRSSRQANVDGAYFGTSFCHLFLQSYWELVPTPPVSSYVPRIFGFKIHKSGSLSFGRIEVTDEFPAIAAATSSSAKALTEPNAEKEPKVPKEPRDPKNPPGAAATPAAPTAPPKASAAGVTVARVPLDEPSKLAAAEIAACQVAQEVTPVQARVMDEAKRLGLSSAMFWRVRSDYYEQELPWRRDVLGASSVQQLCKSMIMENTKLTPEEAAAAGRIKYVCFVLQYAGSKLNKEKMHDAVRAMEGAKAVGKKQYSIRMVSPEISDSLSGYPHNAVTPLGMAHPVPVLLSHKLKSLPDAQLWLGGGEVDLKMRVDVAELMTKLVYEQAGRPPSFADITED